jgi:hypothetical protein
MATILHVVVVVVVVQVVVQVVVVELSPNTCCTLSHVFNYSLDQHTNSFTYTTCRTRSGCSNAVEAMGA